ncbi:hypothetical protein GCM10027290_14670 [Micromonospora sonneratiae]|uniref:Uncharacterized protein n=1 Tax=Micromonospora sonneratiae TaxID=1184706 RepID=A0ABW3YD23_9ACTN
MGVDERTAWRAAHRQAVELRAAAEERRRTEETERARKLVAWFTREAQQRGLRPTALTAVGYNGRTRYQTGLTGWYVDVAHSRAIDVTGDYYLLTVDGGLRARLLGATVRPQAPRLIVGEGGRDGQSVPLRDLLQRRLDAGDDWP